MIASFKHRGLAAQYREKQPAHHATAPARILSALDQATELGELDLPGFRLRELSGPLDSGYAVSVSERQSVTDRFENGQVTNVDFGEHSAWT